MKSKASENPTFGADKEASSPVASNPAEEAFYAPDDAELQRAQSERVDKIKKDEVDSYYLNQHCRPHARF